MEKDKIIKQVERVQAPLVSIILLAFNHIDYTKLCVESLYRFTSHINFELITVNNGSNDGTENFFNTLANEKKINFECNVGGDTAINAGLKLAEGKYTLFLSNDLVLTPHWLDNLLTCMESEKNVGMVVPACSASSNYQQVNLTYNDMEEMFQAAAVYNVSNPHKWEERIRLITYTFLIKTELFKIMGGLAEIYNPGGFDDDDLSFRVRRAGYKLFFAKDTFVHHYGSITINTDYQKLNLLERNRWIFFEKFGVDAWQDCNIDFEIINLIEYAQSEHKDILTLCASCGGNVLQIKNKFRENGLTDITMWVVTEQQKYLPDLKTVSNYAVQGKFENIMDSYKDQQFDYIVLEVDLQSMIDPKNLLQNIIELLRPAGQIVFFVANEACYVNIRNLINGNVFVPEANMNRSSFNVEKIYNFMKDEGFSNLHNIYSQVAITTEDRPFVESLKSISLVPDKNLLEQIYTTRRVIFSAKGKRKFKNILFYPGYDFWLNDVVFNDHTIGNFLGIDTGKNMWAVLRDELSKSEFNLRTIDKGGREQSEYIIFCDMPKSYNNQIFKSIYQQVYRGEYFLKEWQEGCKQSKLVFILMEPPFVMMENYDIVLHRDVGLIFTYLDDLVDNQKYFKYVYPQPLPIHNPYQKSYVDKKLYTLIAGNKFSNVTGELYSERRKAIEFFEGNLPGCLDLYGPGWEMAGYTCYQGQVAGKLATLSQYKYCICYENGIANGYITEKIFDCFFAGCVPIYLGAPNVTDSIPANTFIDGRMFSNYEEMDHYVQAIEEGEYNTYLENINSFLSSEAFEKFTYTNFAQTIAEVLQKNIE